MSARPRTLSFPWQVIDYRTGVKNFSGGEFFTSRFCPGGLRPRANHLVKI